jgi:RNA polymerase sigma-70 factor, ECF subfamily
MNFEEIYKTFSSKVFRLCMGYVNNSDVASDLVQETFISVWKNLEKFRNESSVSTWVYRIATNHCLRQIEKEKKFKDSASLQKIEDNDETKTDEKTDYLYKCISELEETERIIISLVLDDLPYSEIASITGISEGNVRVKVHRIKQKLTDKFSKFKE